MPSRPFRGLPILAGLWGLAAVAVAAQAVPAQDSPTRVLQLTLEDALGIALRNNLDIEIERLVTEEARYRAVGSWGAFDPVVSMTGAASESESEQRNAFAGASVVEDNDLRFSSSLFVPHTLGGSLDFSYDHINSETNSRFATFDVSTADVLTVALTQPLLRGAWKRYATSDQQIFEIGHERQREHEREILQRTLLAVTRAYWDLVSAQDELSVREIAMELGRQQLAQDQRRLEVGAGTEVDVLQSETNVAQQEELRVTAEYNLRQARDLLRRMLAPTPEGSYDEYLQAWDWPIETRTPLPEPEEHPELELDWRVSLQAAIEQRPDLAQRRLDIESAEVQLLQAHSERKPQLDLQLSTSSAGFDPVPEDAFDKALGWDFPSSTAALTFSIPLWNRLATNAERGARVNLRSARLAYQRAELDLLAEVRIVVDEVDKQREVVTAAIKSRTLAQRQLEAEETRQSVGLSTTFQVLEFQEDLALALSTEVKAKAALAKAIAGLAFVEGRMGAELTEHAESPR